MLQNGKGLIFLHHALAGWPLWEEWANIIGVDPLSARNVRRNQLSRLWLQA